MKIVLVPKMTNPMACRFFEPRYVFDLGVLTIGTYVKNKAEVSIKSIFGHLGQNFVNYSDISRLSTKEYLIDFTNYILSENPEVIGFSTMDSSLVNTVLISRAIKSRNDNVKVILGGPGVYYNYADVLENFPFIDFCVRGEGELAFEQFIEYMEGKTKPESVPGLAYRQNGKIRANRLSKPLNVETLPYLSYELYDAPPQALESISCEPGRGCPYKCTFCTTRVFWNNTHRVKTPARLAEEIEHYCGLYKNIKHFDFHSHDNFLKNKNYIIELCEELRKRNLGITWNCSSRIELLDDEYIDVLVESGCNYIDCGIESGSDRIRQLINKNIDVEKTIFNMEKLISNNIGIATNFMFGFPTETLSDMEETFEMACRCNSKKADIVFSLLSPIKNTVIYDDFQELLVTKIDDRLHDFNDTSINFLYSSKGLRKGNNFFANQIIMFHNGEHYNRIVKKIRAVDSVFIFSQYCDILLKIKEELGIKIYESKSALKEFPYSEDLFNFLSKQHKEKKISSRSFVALIFEVLKIQQNTNLKPNSQVEDITLFLSADSWLDQQHNFSFSNERLYLKESVRDFFNKCISLDLQGILKKIDGINLTSAFFINTRSELFLKFTNDRLVGDSVLIGIRFSANMDTQMVCYNTPIGDKEKELVDRIKKTITEKLNYQRFKN